MLYYIYVSRTEKFNSAEINVIFFFNHYEREKREEKKPHALMFLNPPKIWTKYTSLYWVFKNLNL